MTEQTYIFLDCETTGANLTDSPCEVAWIETDADFNVLKTAQSLIDPEQMISPSASGIHGLTNKDCESYPTLSEYFSADDPSCYGKKLPANAVVIGHRISFDLRYLAPYFETPPVEICSLRWARKLYPAADDHKLSTLSYALALPKPENSHRAMSDVITALHLCIHICDRTGMTLPQLAEASKAPMEISTVPFGKWKGTPFAKVPKSYLRWMSENMTDLDMDMRYTIHTLLK